MAYITTRLRSIVLQRTVDVDLYFPSDRPADIVPKINGCITLLHGYNGCSADWVQFTAACRYAADNGLVLVAPNCDNSFYNDMAYGGAFYTYLTEELPELLDKMFNLPKEREKNFVCGLSMGGYGAMLLGFTHPERYAGIGCFSGAVDPGLMMQVMGDNAAGKAVFAPVFGENLTVPQDRDLWNLAQKVAKLPAQCQPKLLVTVGKQDNEDYAIHTQNEIFAKKLKTLCLANYRHMEWDGNHEWKFWDRSLVYAIDYFLHNGYAETKLHDWRCPAEVSGN